MYNVEHVIKICFGYFNFCVLGRKRSGKYAGHLCHIQRPVRRCFNYGRVELSPAVDALAASRRYRCRKLRHFETKRTVAGLS